MRVVILVFVSMPLYGQYFTAESNGIVLQGVKSFDAKVVIGNWMDVRPKLETFQRNMESSFILGLRRDGIVVDSSAPNYLICQISAAQEGVVVFYHYRVEFFVILFELERELLMWRNSGVAIVGINNFTASDTAQTCVDVFAKEWLKWNPK